MLVSVWTPHPLPAFNIHTQSSALYLQIDFQVWSHQCHHQLWTTPSTSSGCMLYSLSLSLLSSLVFFQSDVMWGSHERYILEIVHLVTRKRGTSRGLGTRLYSHSQVLVALHRSSIKVQREWRYNHFGLDYNHLHASFVDVIIKFLSVSNSIIFLQ